MLPLTTQGTRSIRSTSNKWRFTHLNTWVNDFLSFLISVVFFGRFEMLVDQLVRVKNADGGGAFITIKCTQHTTIQALKSAVLGKMRRKSVQAHLHGSPLLAPHSYQLCYAPKMVEAKIPDTPRRKSSIFRRSTSKVNLEDRPRDDMQILGDNGLVLAFAFNSANQAALRSGKKLAQNLELVLAVKGVQEEVKISDVCCI
jgi:hypothetical protein